MLEKIKGICFVLAVLFVIAAIVVGVPLPLFLMVALVAIVGVSLYEVWMKAGQR